MVSEVKAEARDFTIKRGLPLLLVFLASFLVALASSFRLSELPWSPLHDWLIGADTGKVEAQIRALPFRGSIEETYDRIRAHPLFPLMVHPPFKLMSLLTGNEKLSFSIILAFPAALIVAAFCYLLSLQNVGWSTNLAFTLPLLASPPIIFFSAVPETHLYAMAFLVLFCFSLFDKKNRWWLQALAALPACGVLIFSIPLTLFLFILSRLSSGQSFVASIRALAFFSSLLALLLVVLGYLQTFLWPEIPIFFHQTSIKSGIRFYHQYWYWPHGLTEFLDRIYAVFIGSIFGPVLNPLDYKNRTIGTLLQAPLYGQTFTEIVQGGTLWLWAWLLASSLIARPSLSVRRIYQSYVFLTIFAVFFLLILFFGHRREFFLYSPYWFVSLYFFLMPRLAGAWHGYGASFQGALFLVLLMLSLLFFLDGQRAFSGMKIGFSWELSGWETVPLLPPDGAV